MPLPIITDVFQLRLNWTSVNAPRDASNNLYFFDTTGTQTAANLNTDFAAAATAAMWTVVTSTATINRTIATPLDGLTAGVIAATGSPANMTGQGGTDLILQGSSVISVKSTRRGKSGRGRIYLPWVGEVNQANGVLVPANVTAMQTAWNTFNAAMVTAGWESVAVSPALNDAFGPAAYVVRSNLLTQRRRARR